MPFFCDSGEFGANTTMPPQESFSDLVLIPGLSKLIGCDGLLSTWPVKPRSSIHVTKHLSRGAILVEIKRGQDFPGSLLNHRTNHLKKQVIRMLATGAQLCQCVVLYTGLYSPDEHGNLTIGDFDGHRIKWQTTQWNYIHFRHTKSRLQDTLPRFEQLSSNQEIPLWVSGKLSDLEEYKDKPVRTVQSVQLPFSKQHLRELKSSEGAQALLALFNDIGPVAAKRIMDYSGNNMAHAIEALTTQDKILGVQKKSFTSFKEQLGLVNEWSDFGLYVLPLGCQKCHPLEHNTVYQDKDCPFCQVDKSQSGKSKEKK